jgi:hypothetical protein
MKEQKEAVYCHPFETEETTFVYAGDFWELPGSKKPVKSSKNGGIRLLRSNLQKNKNR